jgi:hypothetical protein
VSDHLPAMVSPAGEVVRLITAEHLLQAGGIVDPREAETLELAEFTDNAAHLAAITREAKTVVSDELVRRLDRGGKWTRHEEGFKITSPSPAAGSVSFDTEKLRAALADLLDADLIDEEAATAALEHVHPPPPAPYWKQKAAGIGALLKLGGDVAAAIEGCKVDVEPPKRTAKVTRKAAA